MINFCFSPSARYLQNEWEKSRVLGREFVVFMHIVPITTVPAGRMMIDAEYVKQSRFSVFFSSNLSVASPKRIKIIIYDLLS